MSTYKIWVQVERIPGADSEKEAENINEPEDVAEFTSRSDALEMAHMVGCFADIVKWKFKSNVEAIEQSK